MFEKLKKYFNVSLIGVIGTFAVSAAWAGNQFFYFGAAPSYSATYFNWENNNQSILNKTNAGQVGLFLGYGVLVDKIYLGFEGAGQLGGRTAKSSRRVDDTGDIFYNKASMTDIYMVDFRPGYVWRDKNSMLYGILGFSTANFSLEQMNADHVVVDKSGSVRRDGIRIGLGYNLGLGPYVLARVEYAYTKFSAFDVDDVNEDNNQAINWKLNPSSNEISLGFAFVIHI